MTYASTVLTQELQRAVKNRIATLPNAKPAATPPRPLEYKVSSQAREHLERLRIYREQAKQVRVGTY
jgi:hypothetical protein